ncbi:serine hydrolase [Armatimonas sp.]|uniref:serine hydrolase domain-containing protein n=1 Tax=Armatimonas sp. TaxID=1872638 RepID=UPI00286B0A20|nr:serine hydrolase [Armatimonas sp.]
MISLPRSTPEAQGVDSSGIAAFLAACASSGLELHSVMLVRHGAVIAESWWHPYSSDKRHMLFSLSKSFTATAIGLAVAEGRLSLEDKVISFFPEKSPETVSENLATMRVHDLLTMSTGHAVEPMSGLRAETNDWVASFLAADVPHAPGTHFLYNSLATYMLSAILQKLTGERLLDYLTPRLLVPLGIKSPTWEQCPLGIDTGGWGLGVRTEDIAKFGQLYLSDGIWNGVRLLPEGWVESATKKHIANGDDPHSDWAQGYGFQFWRCRHGAYRGDGAFGQFCIVFPEQDAVLAITSGVKDMQGVLNHIWASLLPAFGGQRELKKPVGAERVFSATYSFPENDQGLSQLQIQSDEEKLTLMLDGHTLIGGFGSWLPGETSFRQWHGKPQQTAGAAAWSEQEKTLTLRLCSVETPFIAKVICEFEGECVTLCYSINASFGPTEFAPLVGQRLM